MINPVLGILCILTIGLIYFVFQSRSQIAIFYLVILILGDSRSYQLAFFKTGRLIILLILTIWTIQDLIQKRYSLQKGILWILPFIILGLISTIIFSPIKFLSYQKTVSYLLVSFVAFHFYADWLWGNEAKNFEKLLHFTAVCLGLGLGLLIIYPDAVMFGERFKGIFGNPNGIGLTCIMWLPYFIFYSISQDRSPSLQWWLYVCLIVLSLILSNSRNGLAGSVLFVGLLWWFKNGTRRFTFFWVILPFVVWFFTSVDFIQLLIQIGLGDYLRVESIKEASGRALSWSFALEQIPKVFWMGGGFAYEEYVYEHLVPPSLQMFREMSSTWNSYLTLMLNNGIIGTTLFLTFIFAQLKYAQRNLRWKMLGYLVAILLAAIYETWLTSSLNAYTIFFLIMITYFHNPPQTFSNKTKI
ncbi:MAG: O-antigen ligase family protein [Bacteroidia bacterium]|nr:O-antigen ligase family protein [Bacteroidia bacterium]